VLIFFPLRVQKKRKKGGGEQNNPVPPGSEEKKGKGKTFHHSLKPKKGKGDGS